MVSAWHLFVVLTTVIYSAVVAAEDATFPPPTPAAARGNKYPIILVHGFAGVGRDEMNASDANGNFHWGGNNGDWQEDLKAQGFDVRTATVGPFSSNWDRACELYAYIKGGTVHYGAKHAAKHGHSVTGRTFPGLFPEWGEVVNGELQKVHLVGHSMGGQTIRMLAQLLAEGAKGAPTQEDPRSHPLFEGGKHWIHSITTVSSPNQGTLLADGFDSFGDLVENVVARLVTTVNAFGDGASELFDFHFDQWGVAPRSRDETVVDYVKRVSKSSILKNAGADLALFSLSTAGAKQDATWVKTQSNVFYYSITNSDTFRLGPIVLPRPLSMMWTLQPLAVFLGSNFPLSRGYSKEWQVNDGVVPTASMGSDGIADVVSSFKESKMGRWHQIGPLTTLDHQAMIGNKKDVNALSLYVAQARLLYELPAVTVADGPQQRRLEGVVHQHSGDVTRRLAMAVEAINTKADGDEEESVAVTCANPTDAIVRALCVEHRRR